MKKLVVSLIFICLLLSLFSINVSALFPKDHIAFTVDGFNEVSSPIVSECLPYIDIVLDGDNGADGGVLHYGSSLVTSYIYTHTAAGYQQCLNEAGSNIQKKCLCVGMGLHITQDAVSHIQDGLVQKYLTKYAGTNYFGHMVVENDFQNKHIATLIQNNDYAISSGQLDYYNSIYLDNLVSEDGQSASEYLKMINKIANFDLTTDILRLRSNYQGSDFYKATGQARYTGGIPWWATSIIIGLLVVSLVFMTLTIWRGVGIWKWINAAWWMIIFIIGVVLLISILTLTFWSLITNVMSFTSNIGYLSVSSQDVTYYSTLAQKTTNDFLQTGQLKTIDATGLSYCSYQNPSTGLCDKQVTGALSKAEMPSKWIFYGLITPIYLLLSFYFSYKAFKRKK